MISHGPISKMDRSIADRAGAGAPFVYRYPPAPDMEKGACAHRIEGYPDAEGLGL